MKDQRGYALITTLWLVVAMSAITLQFGLDMREQRLVMMNRLEDVRGRAVATAGIQHARLRLTELARDRSGIADAWARADTVMSDPIEMRDDQYVVTLEDPGARLHLNHATEDDIRRLLIALRVDDGRADRIAQAILDWRDADNLHRARGAESEYYERSGSARLPRNGPFASLHEFRFVRDVTPEIYDRVEPYLTLAGSGRVNIAVAERPVLLALPGMTEEAVRLIERQRRRRQRVDPIRDLMSQLSPPAQETFEESLPALMSRTRTESTELIATSEAIIEGGRLGTRIAALFVLGGDNVFLVWQKAL